MAKKKDIPEIAEHYLWNFVHSMQLSRAQRKDAQPSEWEKTLDHAVRLVEAVLEGNRNPSPKKRGRKPEPDIRWLCFHHMLPVGPISDNTSQLLSRYSDDGSGFDLVGKNLKLAAKTVESNYYEACEKGKTRKGRQEYVDWLNRREKRWEV